MDDREFVPWLTDQLASLPNVVAVALGGSRARDAHGPESDWDFAIYYEGRFDPDALRSKRWDGEVSDVGGWGGGVMNRGAWLVIDGRRVDVHYRDLGEVLYWCAEAEAGRFQKELLLFYVAGIPTYTVMGELALNRVVAGDLPRPEYPDALAAAATGRWLGDARASLGYAHAALAQRGDVLTALANASRGIVEAAHGRLAAQKRWVLNEKGIGGAADLTGVTDSLFAATTPEELRAAISRATDATDTIAP
jgi:predicted nucleotidyltransferase